MSDQLYAVIDYETRSKLSVKTSGAYEYARHPSTKVMCVAFRVAPKALLRQAPIKVWAPILGDNKHKSRFLEILRDPTIIKIAHNAMFEECISMFVLGVTIDFSLWRCTAARARAMSVPGKLSETCKALELPIQKDEHGHRLMLKCSRPRKPTKNDPAIWYDKKEELEYVCYTYCPIDVEAETEVFLTLPPLSKEEQKVWEWDQKINFRGFQIDRDLVTNVIAMRDQEMKFLNEETNQITGGEVDRVTKRDKMVRWLRKNGAYIENLKADTIRDGLAADLFEGDCKRLLQIRQFGSKSSTSKYDAFELRSRTDGRVRDGLMYHTAGTGRWGGAGVQPQNLPRGKVKSPKGKSYNMDLLAGVLRQGDLEAVRILYKNPMEAFSSALRGVLIAPPGKTLTWADFAAIELRVLFWMSSHEKGLVMLREGKDLYADQASDIYSKPVEDIVAPERFTGKEAVLGCGYGLGWKMFINHVKRKSGVDVSEDLAKRSVNSYRRKNKPVTSMWKAIEHAAISAVRNPGMKYSTCKTKWYMRERFLYCELPSGRTIHYCDASVGWKMNQWGDKKPTLFYWGVNATTKKWQQQDTWGGSLTENVVQATARDLTKDSLLRIDGPVYQIVLHVHDEDIAERNKNKGSTEEFQKLMAVVPDWAKGCPIKTEGWSSERYKK